jgi:dolichyl-phosphate beta-glucosyltransferase
VTGARLQVSRVTLVVPCYNEAGRLPVARFGAGLRELPEVRFVFVDDGSTDGTLGLLRSLQGSDAARVDIIELPHNQGKAAAVRAGMLHALALGARYVGYWDADLSTPLDAIPEFAALLDARPDLEMVFGARVQLLGRVVRRNEARHYLGRVFATAVAHVLGLKIYDTQCGAKLFRAAPELRELFGEPFLTRWVFDVEILARLIRARRGTGRPQPEDIVYEYPLQAWIDVPGSKVRPWDFVRGLAALVRIHRHYRANRR